jgi:hypothetical protein
LVYKVPGYSNDVQEVLARIRMVAFQRGDPARGGVGLAIGTNSHGMNLLFRDHTNEAALRHFKLLDDTRSWGPTNLTNDWSNNVWYWLRLRQDPKMDGSNTIFGKVWLADWTTPEPPEWQLTWLDSALKTPHLTGLAGITASSNDGLAQFEVSYFLLKAAGLPNIRVSAAASAPAMQTPLFVNGITQTATNVSVAWFGAGSLVASPSASGPWTNVVSTTNSYVTPKANLKPAEFYRIQYPQ